MSEDQNAIKPYSIRNMPEKFKDRLKAQAEYETKVSRASGSGFKSIESLFLECAADGLARREAKRKKAEKRRK